MLKSKMSPCKWKNKSFLFLVWILFFYIAAELSLHFESFSSFATTTKIRLFPPVLRSKAHVFFFFHKCFKTLSNSIQTANFTFFFLLIWVEVWRWFGDFGRFFRLWTSKIIFLKKKIKLVFNPKCEFNWTFTTFYFLFFPYLNHKLKTSRNRLRFLPSHHEYFFTIYSKENFMYKEGFVGFLFKFTFVFFFGERWVTSYNNFNIITVHMLFFFNFTVSSSSKPFTTEVPSTVIMNSLLSFSIKWIMQIVK